MLIVDANIILRLILNDNEDMVNQARTRLLTDTFYIKREVIAEVVYVLSGVYNTGREDVRKAILELIDTERIIVESEDVVRYAIDAFKMHKLDLVDCLLYAYNQVDGEGVFTFDKKLKKLLQNIHNIKTNS
jgi:predicted nucleic-acid-binding protein